MSRPRSGLQRALLRVASSVAAWAALVATAAATIDRPASTWLHDHLGDARFALFRTTYDGRPLAIGPFSFLASPAALLGPLAVGALAWLAMAAAGGWRPGRRGRVLLALSVSVLVANEINRQAKSVFGRTWPESWLGDNPSWIRDGMFGFYPFHGGSGWSAFPSGHTTAVTTAATLLWIAWPQLRPLWAALVVTVAAGLIGANYHFVSDVIGGAGLGILVGHGVAGLMLAPDDRLRWPPGASDAAPSCRPDRTERDF